MGAIIEGRERSHSERENIFCAGKELVKKYKFIARVNCIFVLFYFFLPDVDSFSGSKKNVLLTKKGKRGKKVCEFVDFRKSDYKSGKHLSPLSYSHKYQHSHFTTSFLMRLFQVKRNGKEFIPTLNISLPVLRLPSNPDTNDQNKSV